MKYILLSITLNGMRTRAQCCVWARFPSSSRFLESSLREWGGGGVSAGSFLDQRKVIEPTVNVLSKRKDESRDDWQTVTSMQKFLKWMKRVQLQRTIYQYKIVSPLVTSQNLASIKLQYSNDILSEDEPIKISISHSHIANRFVLPFKPLRGLKSL